MVRAQGEAAAATAPLGGTHMGSHGGSATFAHVELHHVQASHRADGELHKEALEMEKLISDVHNHMHHVERSSLKEVSKDAHGLYALAGSKSSVSSTSSSQQTTSAGAAVASPTAGTSNTAGTSTMAGTSTTAARKPTRVPALPTTGPTVGETSLAGAAARVTLAKEAAAQKAAAAKAAASKAQAAAQKAGATAATKALAAAQTATRGSERASGAGDGEKGHVDGKKESWAMLAERFPARPVGKAPQAQKAGASSVADVAARVMMAKQEAAKKAAAASAAASKALAADKIAERAAERARESEQARESARSGASTSHRSQRSQKVKQRPPPLATQGEDGFEAEASALGEDGFEAEAASLLREAIGRKQTRREQREQEETAVIEAMVESASALGLDGERTTRVIEAIGRSAAPALMTVVEGAVKLRKEEIAVYEAALRESREEEADAQMCDSAEALGFDYAAAARLLEALSGAAERPTLLGPEALLDTVASGAIAPLKGSWLVALEARGGKLARRQELPSEAFFSAVELRRLVEGLGDDYGLLFVALSYRHAPVFGSNSPDSRSMPPTLIRGPRGPCRPQVAEQGPPGPRWFPSGHRRGGGAAVYEG